MKKFKPELREIKLRELERITTTQSQKSHGHAAVFMI